MVEIETRSRIPIWRTFGRIQGHVFPEPPATLQGAATWRIHCHDPRAICHIAGCKNSIRHIENRYSPYFIFIVFLMQFGLWWAAAFVSSPIHLFNTVAVPLSLVLHMWSQMRRHCLTLIHNALHCTRTTNHTLSIQREWRQNIQQNAVSFFR